MTTQTPVTPHKYEGPTRKSHTSGYEDYPTAARAMRVKVTAGDRHAARVLATKQAVFALFAKPETGDSSDSMAAFMADERAALGAALITLDLARHEDRFGHASSTQRMRWASGLGTGRWRAHDGDAWAAAARDARGQLMEEFNCSTPEKESLLERLGVSHGGYPLPRGITRLAADYLAGDEFLWLVGYVVQQLRHLAAARPNPEDAAKAREWVDALWTGLDGEELTPAVLAELSRWELEDERKPADAAA